MSYPSLITRAGLSIHNKCCIINSMNKLKKLLVLSILATTFISAVVFAQEKLTDRNKIRDAKMYLRSKIIFWQKLYDCTPYYASIGNTYYEIAGKENKKCHLIINQTDCYYPMEVAKKYSYNGEKLLRKIIDEIDTKGTIEESSLQQEANYIQQINFQYCNLYKY